VAACPELAAVFASCDLRAALEAGERFACAPPPAPPAPPAQFLSAAGAPLPAPRRAEGGGPGAWPGPAPAGCWAADPQPAKRKAAAPAGGPPPRAAAEGPSWDAAPAPRPQPPPGRGPSGGYGGGGGRGPAGRHADPSLPVTATFQTALEALGGRREADAAVARALPARGPAAPFRPPGRAGGAAAPPPASRALAAGGAGGGGGEGEETLGLPAALYARVAAGPAALLEAVRKCEPALVSRICDEILERPAEIGWEDIAGLEHAKAVVQEVAVWPLLAPELFQGARAVPAGLLLFGPPGTGKTLIGRAVAAQARATFFAISASSLGSKWIGEGEKLVRALFAVAAALSPSVIFIDEVDALLSARKGGEGEHEASRRLKTELLVQMEGCGASAEGGTRVLLVGATNRPSELDEAARRRLAKQVYIPLPCAAARAQIVRRLLGKGGAAACRHTLGEAELHLLTAHTAGYSGSDMKHLVQEAARAPLRELRGANVDLAAVRPESVRAITIADFRRAARQVRPSVTPADVAAHEEWNARHGAQALTAGEEDSDGEWGVAEGAGH